MLGRSALPRQSINDAETYYSQRVPQIPTRAVFEGDEIGGPVNVTRSMLPIA